MLRSGSSQLGLASTRLNPPQPASTRTAWLAWLRVEFGWSKGGGSSSNSMRQICRIIEICPYRQFLKHCLHEDLYVAMTSKLGSDGAVRFD